MSALWGVDAPEVLKGGVVAGGSPGTKHRLIEDCFGRLCAGLHHES